MAPAVLKILVKKIYQDSLHAMKLHLTTFEAEGEEIMADIEKRRAQGLTDQKVNNLMRLSQATGLGIFAELASLEQELYELESQAKSELQTLHRQALF